MSSSILGIISLLILAILVNVIVISLWVLICISMKNEDHENLFTCLFVICIFSLVQCLFRSFAHSIYQSVCLLLNYKSCLYIFNISPLSDKSFADVFHFLFLNKFIYLFVCLFLAALGLCCCAQSFSNCGEQGLLFIAVHRLLISVASLVAQHRL